MSLARTFRQISILLSPSDFYPTALHDLPRDSHLTAVRALMVAYCKDPFDGILDARFLGTYWNLGNDSVAVTMLLDPDYSDDTIKRLVEKDVHPVECVTLGPVPPKIPATVLQKLLRVRCPSAEVLHSGLTEKASVVVASKSTDLPGLLSISSLLPNTRLRFRRLNLITNRMEDLNPPSLSKPEPVESKRLSNDVEMKLEPLPVEKKAVAPMMEPVRPSIKQFQLKSPQSKQTAETTQTLDNKDNAKASHKRIRSPNATPTKPALKIQRKNVLDDKSYGVAKLRVPESPSLPPAKPPDLQALMAELFG